MGQEFQRLAEKNAELQQQLAKSRSTATKAARQPRSSGQLDWEAEKRRILAALEADVDGDDQAQREERLRMQEVVDATDEAIAAKDREIRELSERLEAGNRNAAASAPARSPSSKRWPGMPACGRNGRSCNNCRTQWQEKIRQAEVELALERANLARQRAELEGHVPAAGDAALSPPAATDPEPAAKSSTPSRWMARLGLTDADREPVRNKD